MSKDKPPLIKDIGRVTHNGRRLKGIDQCGFSIREGGVGILFIGTNSLWFRKMRVADDGKTFLFSCGGGETYSFTLV